MGKQEEKQSREQRDEGLNCVSDRDDLIEPRISPIRHPDRQPALDEERLILNHLDTLNTLNVTKIFNELACLRTASLVASRNMNVRGVLGENKGIFVTQLGQYLDQIMKALKDSDLFLHVGLICRFEPLHPGRKDFEKWPAWI